MSFTYGSNHNSKSHKIAETQLVSYLDKIDPLLTKATRENQFGFTDWSGIIDLFIKQHYLIKVLIRKFLFCSAHLDFYFNCSFYGQDKEDDVDGSAASVIGLGPRALLEVGRRQILSFSHEAVGQAVDPSLLKEIEDDEAAAAQSVGAEDEEAID